MNLRTKFLIISLIAVLPLVVVATEYFRALEAQEATVLEIEEDAVGEMQSLSNTFAETSDNHSRIFALLSSAGKAHDEEEIYENAKALVNRIRDITAAVERYHTDLGTQIDRIGIDDAEREIILRKYGSAEILLKDLEDYRIEVVRAIEMVTVDLSLFGRYAIQANEIVRKVHHGFQSLIADTQDEVGLEITALRKDNEGRIRRFQIMIVVAGLISVGMVLVTARVSKGLSGDLRRIIAVMSDVARGDADVTVPFLENPDEVGEIARATRVFIGNLVMLRKADREKTAEIAERKRAEGALRENELRFRTVVDNLPSFFSLKDVDGRYVLANHEFFRVFDVDSEALPQLKGSDFIPKEEAEKSLAHDREVIETANVITQERDIPVDGETRTYLVTKFPITDASGAVTGVGSLGTDVTDIKQTEAQLVQSAKLATLGQMASGIAHELNQPLNIIRMAAESSLMRIEDGELDVGTWKEKLDRIEGQAERMAKIIDHMRVFARQDNTREDCVFSPGESVNNALTLMEQQLVANGVTLERNIPEGGGFVRGSPVQLEQVVMNLLSNARQAVAARMEAAAAGNEMEGRIEVALADVDDDTNAVTISVTDNGGGIPPEVRAHIFDPFYTTKEEGEGTGLGLSISYKIIEGMGGWLDAVDVEGGTRFEIVLPRCADAPATAEEPPEERPAAPRPADEKDLPASPPSEENPAAADDRPARPTAAREAGNEATAGKNLCRVLVVDDEEMAADSLAEYLERKGYDVATAGNGSEALEIFGDHAPNVVITDLRMPVMDGYELIRRLREAHPNLPILVTTGHTTMGDDADAYPEGATYVIKKPISLREIVDTLDAGFES